MPNLADHHSSRFVKMLYIGDSSTGKTGSLTSLVGAGYKLRVLDLDNGLDSLRHYAKAQFPDKLPNVDYEVCRDQFKASPIGPVVAGKPKAYADALKLMEKWTDGSDPAEWGEDTIFVLDSLSALGTAAFEWAKGMNPSAREPRTWFFSAQQAVEKNIALLTSEHFHTNVIIISHVRYSETQEGVSKGYANSIGTALGPIIPRYFNTMILAESSGSGQNVKRKIKTLPTGAIDLKTPTPKVEKEVPLETGLATIFAQLKDNTNA